MKNTLKSNRYLILEYSFRCNGFTGLVYAEKYTQDSIFDIFLDIIIG
jgi:hypothetical protein